MKGLKAYAVLLTLFYAFTAAGLCLWLNNRLERRTTEQNIAINRINAEIASAETEPEDTIAERFPEWQSTYGSGCPESVIFLPLEGGWDKVFLAESSGSSTVCVLYRGGKIYGAVSYGTSAKKDGTVTAVTAGCFLLCFIVTAAFVWYVYKNILKPFRGLSEYPERLARLGTADRLPESRNRYFGKYVWGMNMLADRLENDRRRISELEYKRQTLLASIAHGVKTPVANIKLYASAIMTGLYSDADNNTGIAEKIDANADKISNMVTALMETSASSISGFEPELNPFYLSELRDLLSEEFSGRLGIAHIPFSVVCENDTLINSDKWGLFRVFSQLIENAVKYGDGTGITITMQKQDDGFCFFVRNKGGLLPEKELPYIFKSYWRGSNAAETEGSGIGLYVAHDIIRKLGGTIVARRLEETSEMEFMIYLE